MQRSETCGSFTPLQWLPVALTFHTEMSNIFHVVIIPVWSRQWSLRSPTVKMLSLHTELYLFYHAVINWTILREWGSFLFCTFSQTQGGLQQVWIYRSVLLLYFYLPCTTAFIWYMHQNMATFKCKCKVQVSYTVSISSHMCWIYMNAHSDLEILI